MHRHGYYSRNVITLSEIYIINILRLKCPCCNKTHAVLPPFIIPYYQYTFGFISFCLLFNYKFNYSYNKCLNAIKSFNPNSSFNHSSISFYKNRFEATSSIINLFFANYEEFYYDVNTANPITLINKIFLFDLKNKNFNSKYYSTMPYYFMAPPLKKEN